MTGVDFSIFEHVAKCYGQQRHEVRGAIAGRAALRVLARAPYVEDTDLERSTLACLRANLTAIYLPNPGPFATLDDNVAQEVRSNILPITSSFSGVMGEALKKRNDPNYEIEVSVPSGLPMSLAAFLAVHAITEHIEVSEAYITTLLGLDHNSQSDPKNILSTSQFIEDVQNAHAADTNVWNHINATPLWLDEDLSQAPNSAHGNFVKYLSTDIRWEYWLDWYKSMCAGNFDGWELACEIINIPNHVWKDGAKAVADEIENLKATLFFKNSPQVEDIFQTSDGLYDVRSSVVDISTLIDSVLKRIEFSYGMAIQSNHCDLSSMNVAAQTIRHVLENCRDDPNALEQYLRNARSLIQRGIDDNQLAPSDELTMLITTLDETTLQLRADHPDVAAAVQARTKQRLKEIDDNRLIAIASNMDEMREVTALRLSEEYRLDAAITRDGSDADAISEAIQRSGHRAGKINLAEQAKKAEGSGVMSGLKIGLRAKTLYDAALELMAGIPM